MSSLHSILPGKFATCRRALVSGRPDYFPLGPRGATTCITVAAIMAIRLLAEPDSASDVKSQLLALPEADSDAAE